MDLSNSLFDVKGLNIKSNNNLKDSSTIFSSLYLGVKKSIQKLVNNILPTLLVIV